MLNQGLNQRMPRPPIHPNNLRHLLQQQVRKKPIINFKLYLTQNLVLNLIKFR